MISKLSTLQFPNKLKVGQIFRNASWQENKLHILCVITEIVSAIDSVKLKVIENNSTIEHYLSYYFVGSEHIFNLQVNQQHQQWEYVGRGIHPIIHLQQMLASNDA